MHIETIDWHDLLEIPKKIMILGREYDVDIISIDDTRLGDTHEMAYGMCGVYEPIIEIYNDHFDQYQEFSNTLKLQVENTFRHEMMHAVFIEAGLDNTYGDDETLVDFLAFQLPKIKKYI